MTKRVVVETDSNMTGRSQTKYTIWSNVQQSSQLFPTAYHWSGVTDPRLLLLKRFGNAPAAELPDKHLG